MHLNTHYQHSKDVLNRFMMRLGFVVFILLGYSYQAFSQTLTVCDESTFTGYDLFEADNTPNGHRAEGEWTSTGGLIFSNVNDPNSLITVPASIAAPTTVTIVWTYKNGNSQHTYTVLISSNTWSTADPVLLSDGSTDDILLCSQQDVDFEVDPPGTNLNYEFQYWTVNPTTGLYTLVDDYSAAVNYPLDAGDYTLLDGVFAIVKTNTTGCTAKTNEITISDVSTIQVQVVGGYTVCDGATIPNVDLEVIPFNTSDFNYTWYFDDGSGPSPVSVNTSTYSIVPADGPGDYYVEVVQKNSSVGCPGTNTSNVVSVRNYSLPDVTISTSASICSDATQVDLTSSLSSIPVNLIEYDWYRNTTMLVDGLTGTSNYTNTTLPLAGTYKVIIREQGNEECWKESNSVVVTLDGVTNVDLTATNGLPNKFCLSGDPNVDIAITGGTAPYTVVISNDRGLPAETFNNVTANANLDLNTLSTDNTNYWVSSVTDAAGCNLTLSQDATSSNYAQFGVYTSPVDRPITSKTICETSSSTVQLPSSEAGIDYSIYRDGVTLGEPVQTGTGATLTWGPYNTPGTYEVYATTATCPDILMSGQVIIEPNVALVNVSSSVAGTLCSDALNPITFSTDASEDGVVYTLYRDYGGVGEVAIVPSITGNAAGSGLSFTPQSTTGTYSVVATRNGVCDRVMTNTYIIYASPDVSGITLSATSYCEGENTTITLSDSETGVTYTLYDDATGLPVVPTYSVAGFTGNSRNIVTNQPLAAGDYTVLAKITSGTCTSWITDVITIVSAPTDIAFTTSGYVCNSGSLVLSVAGESGVTYTLYKNGVIDPIYPSITGNSFNTVQFNGLVPGVYSVEADNGTCTTMLSDILTVEAMPVAQTITVADNDYCANEPAVTIQVDDTEAGVEYELYNTVTSTVDQSITGTGAAITFTGVTEGTYTIRATTNSCTLNIQTGIVITEHPVATVNANIPSDYCSDDGNPQVIKGSPSVVSGSSTGVYQIIGGAGFDPGAVIDANAGTLTFDPGNTAFETLYTIQYTYTDGNGCVVTEIGTTTVHDLNGGAVTIDRGLLPLNPCQDDNTNYSITGMLNGVAVNGPFSSTSAGFSDPDPTDATAIFNPATAGNGTHVIYFNYTDPATSCTGQGSITVTIGTPLNLIGLNTQYCSADGLTYTLDGNPSGGTFTVTDPGGTVIGSAIPDGTSWLNPFNLFNSASGDGTYTIVYTYTDANSCTNTLTSTFDIVESVDASFHFPNNATSGLEQTIWCENDGAVTLTANESMAGLSHFYTGDGVAGSTFIPSDPTINYNPTANVITHTVNNQGCITTATRNAYVTKMNLSIGGLASSYCTNSGVQTIFANSYDHTGTAITGEATFSATANGNPTVFLTEPGANDNSATIDPSVGVGTYEITMHFVNDGDGCEKTITQSVIVYDAIPVAFGGVSNGQKICSSSADITLTGTLPDGGKGNFVLLGGAPGLTDATADDGVAVLSPSAMTPNTYTIRYNYESTDGCLSSFDVSIEIIDAPTTTYSVTGGGAYCIDDPAPKGVAVGLGGSDTGVEYELLLNGNSIGAGITHTGAGTAFDFTPVQEGVGTYTVVADYGGCTATMTGSVTIEQYELVLQQVSKNNISCNGLSDGTVTLLATGGSGSYEYSDDSGVTWQASPTFTGLSLGDHDFSVKDLSSAACEAIDVLTINITQPTVITITEIENIPVGCSGCSVAGGTCEGSSTITISGGTPDYVTYPGVGYDIQWSTSGTSLTETNMPAGTHSVTVTDGNGCTQNLGIIISTIAPALSLTENIGDHVDNVCNGDANGSYTVTASGGSGTYEFSLTDPTTTTAVWVPGNVAADQYQVSTLLAGSYDIWVRDANSVVDYSRCFTQISSPIVITEPLALTLVEESQVGITCNGATDGSFIVQGSNAESGSYEFSETNPAIGATWVAGPAALGGDRYEVSGLGAGTYRIWMRDAVNTSCTYTYVDVTLSDLAAFTFDLDEHTNVSCNSGNDGRLEVTAQGGSGNYVYQWEQPLGTVISTDKYIEDLTAGDYYLTIRDNDPLSTCADITQTYTITEPAVLTVDPLTISIEPADCTGQNTGSVTVDVIGGTEPYTITWSTGATSTESISALAPGNYTINVVDAKGCIYNNSGSPYVVGVLDPITLLVPATITDNSCNGGNSGSIYVQVQGGSGSGNYQFRLEGPIIKDWSNSTSATLDDFTFTGLVEGNYDVKVSDVNNVNCEYIVGSYTLTDPVALGLSTQSTSNVTCYNGADGSITVLASGGSGVYDFNVDNSGYVAGGNPFTVSGLSAGDHTIWVRDSGAPTCQYQLHPVITITQVSKLDLSVTSSTNVTCNSGTDGEVVLTATGGSGDYDFSKDGGATWDVGTTNVFNYDNLTAGLYTFQVRDHNSTGCAVDVETLTITEPLDFTTTCVATDVDCFGESTGVLTLSTTYTGSIPGAFTYSIDGGTTWQSTPITGLASGTYVVDVKDNTTGCIKTNQVSIADATITEPSASITIGAELITNVTCYEGTDGEIDLQGNVSGGKVSADYKYTWYKKSTPNVIVSTGSDVASNLKAGTYFVVVEDDNGCSKTSGDYIITQPSDWNVDYTASDLTKYNGADGVIDVHTHTGSNPVHSIEWFTVVGGVEATMSPLYDDVWTVNTLQAGTYRFKITDGLGCIYVSDDIVIAQPLEFKVTDPNTNKTNVSCFGDNNGIIKVEIVSGTGDFTLAVTGTLAEGSAYGGFNDTQATSNFELTDLYAGQYNIVVTDNHTGEVLTYIVEITQPDQLTVDLVSLQDITCNGGNDGEIVVEINGATIDETVSTISWARNPVGWSLSGTVDDGTTDLREQTGLYAGTYTVNVLSEKGCSATPLTVTLTEKDAITATEQVTHVTTNGGNDGRIYVNNIVSVDVISSIVWYKKNASGAYIATGATGIDNDNITAGIYRYVITDTEGCTFTSNDILVSEPGQALNVVVTPTSINCYGDDSGIITVNITTGVAPFTVTLTGTHDDGTTFTAKNSNKSYTEFTDLKAGTYQVIVTDDEGQSYTENDIVISENPQTILTVTPTDIHCYGETSTIELSLSGRTNGSESWQLLDPALGEVYNGPLAGNNIQTVGLEGEYTIVLTNQDGCILTNKVTINEPDELVAVWNATDASIYGLNDGIIDVHTVTGGNGAPYTISWTDDASVNDFLRNDLLAGTYTFTVEDNDGCTVTYSDIVGQPNPLTVVVTPQDAICYGDANGEIQVEFQSHNGGYYYQITGNEDDGGAYDSNIINPTSVNSVVKNLEAGTYSIDAYDSKGTHYHQENIRIEQDAEVNLLATVSDITCYGTADGSVVVALDSRAPLATDNIVWSGSKGTYLAGDLINNNEIDPVTFGESFDVVVTSVKGCTYTGTFEVKEPNQIIISVDNIEDVTCVNGADGAIDISVTGRTGGGYTYTWEKKDGSGVYQPYTGNTASLTGLSAGEYQVTVESISDNCTATYSDIEVLDGSEITINETLTHITSCVGDNSGVITVSVEDGIPPYTVDVTGQATKTGDGSAAFVFSNLYAGNYVIEVSDARGVSCATVTKNVTITEPSVAFGVSNLVYNIDCDPVSSTSGTFTFDITGGVPSGGNYRYQIILPEASLTYPVTVPVGSTYSESLNNLTAGSYNLTVLDLNSSDPSNCQFEYQFDLEHIVISNDPVVNTTCKGINNGSITGITIEGASNNYTYNWITTDGGLGIDNSTLNQSGLSVGTYILTITDPDRGACSVSKEFYIDVDNTIVINPTVKDVSCNGGTDGAISIDVTGISPTTTYTWTGPGIVNSTLKDQVNLTSGNYTVEITSTIDGQTCIADRAYTVDQPGAISYTARYEYTDCDPYVRTLVVENVAGGSGNYSYLWDGPSFTPVVPADPTNVAIYQGGVYSITVKDENQCELTKSLSVTNEISIDPVINDVTCNGGNNGSIVLNVSGGSGQYNFSWVGPSGYTSIIRNIDNLYAGDYTVIITDQNENDGSANCYREFTLTVEEPNPIEIISTVENTSCFGASDGLIEIEVSGGTAPYTYNWSPVVGSNLATNRNQYDLPADTYTVTVTDAAGKGGCIATKDIEVKQDAEIILSTVVTDTQCDGTTGAIDLTVSGGSGAGFAYDWSSADGSGLVQGDQDQSGLSGGTFTVVVSDLGDGRSCKATISETLTHEIEVINEVVSPVSCSGNDDGSISYDVTGGDGNYTYTWNVISGDATRIVAGSRNQSGLSEGEYEVTITDGRTVGATDCAITHTFIVPATTGLSVNVAVEDSKMCFGEPGGKLTAAVTGGSGDYKYYWNGVEGTNVLDNLVQGIYGLEVVDNVLGCNYIQSYEIKGPNAPLTIDNIVVTDVLCYNENTGAIQVTVSGGTLPSSGDYIYTWTGGATAATGSNPTNLYAGTYNLTVTDANGCTVESGNIIVAQPTSYIKVDNPQITDVSINGGSDGQILVDVYDGVAPRSVEWFDASNTSLGTLNPLTGLSAGTYSVIATDGNGCPIELTGLRVVEPGENLGFEKTVHQISPCNGADNGEIHINRVFGGYPIDGDHYRIQITGPGTNVDTNGTSYDLTGLAPGTYRVIVTDDVPVTYQEDIIINEYSALSLTSTKLNDVTCYGTSTGTIEVTVSGGKADASNYYLVEITSSEGYYNYNDNVLANTPFTFSNLPAGNYTIRLIDHAEDFDTKVPDRGNCELSEFTLITEPSALVELTAVGGDNEMCNGESIDLSISTSNWDFITQGNIRVAVYDNFTTTEYTVDKTPYVITETPSSSRTYKVMNVVNPSNATCSLGESTGSQVQVIVHDLPTANITGPTQVCEDGTVTLNVSFTGAQPFSFTWQDVNNGTSNTISGITTSSYTFTDTPIADASYIILDVSDDNTCTNSGNGQVDVSINNKPVITLSGSTDICFGETTPLMIAFNENKAPYIITYEANGVEGTLIVTPNASLTYTWNVSPLVTTTYEITSVVDSKGCLMDMVVPVQATVIVDQLPEPLDEITSTSDNGEVCQGILGIDYSVSTVSYATNYVWTVEAGMNITSGNGTNNITVDFDRDFAGGYVRVYAENACGVNTTIERWVNSKVIPDPILTAPTGPTQLCQGATGLIYSITPVDNATSYEWLLPTGLVLQGDGTGTSIIVDLDSDVPSTVGDIYVRPINECSSDEPWSPVLTVTINPLPESYAGPDDRICQTTYTLNADPLIAGQSGVWTIEGGAAQFTNKPVDQVRPNADIYNLSQGENTFIWTVTNTATGCSVSDEVVISNDQVTVNASVSDTEVCDGTVTLFGTPVNAVSNADEGVWTTTGAGFIVESTNDETVVNDLDQGTNSFTWTIRKGSCYSSATVEVTNNKPTEPIIYDASDVAIDLQDLPCQTDFTTLRGTTPTADETGYWRIESGSLTIDNKNSASISITNIAKGDHVLSWNILRGDCLLKALVTIRNNALDVDAGNDRYSCDGTTQLNATEVPSGAIGQWTIIQGTGYFVDGGDQAATEVTGLDQSTPNGVNIFRWTLTRNGCESYDEVTIYNDQPSTAEIAGGSSSISVCDYEYTLHAVAPQYGTGVWSVVGGQGKFDNPTDPNTRVYDLANGDNIFRWTVSNNTCSSYVDFKVSNLHIDAYAGADTAVCGRTAKLNATPVPDGATGQWTLVSGSAGVIFNPANTQADAYATSLGHGSNSLVWTITKDGCVSTDTVIVSNNAPYEVNASTYIYTDGNSTTLRAEIPDIGTGVWTLVEGRGEIANPNSATTEVTNLLPNYNYFRWTVSNANCFESIDVAVQSGTLADADAGLDQLHLCEDYTTLSANEPEGTYGEWTIVEGSADFESYNNATTKITNIRSGQNVFRWTLRFAGGSENFTTDTVIVINNKPTDADAGLDIYECGDMATLNAREPIVGSPTWSVLSGGGIFSDDTDPKSIVSELAKGENVFKYQIQQDICFSYDTISVFNYEPSDAYAGEDQVVCQDSAVLNPEIPKYGEGSWRIIEGSGKGKDADGNEIDEIEGGYVYSLAPGTNKLVWEVKVPEASSSCVKRDTLTIINNQPSVSFAGHDRSICTDTVSLSGSVPVYGEGTWTLLSGSGTIENASQTNTLVTNLAVGKNRFRWTIDNNGCTSYTDVEIANNLIEAFAGYDQVNCVDTASLEGNNPSPGVGTWGIVGGSGSANFEDNESPYTEVKNLDKGENVLTWTIDYKGCRSVSEVKITNNEPSEAIAGDNKATCENSIVLGAANPEVGTGSWTIRSGGGDFEDATDNSTQVNNLKFGSNVFRWTVENNGCTLYDDVEISFNRIDAEVGGTQEICADHTFLEANNASPGIGTWSVVGGSGQARFVDTHDATTEVLDLAKGSNILRWTINNEGCSTSAEVTVINHTPSTAYAGNTQEICESETVLDATAVSIGTGSWEVLIGSGTIASDMVNNPKANISGLSKGENVLRWTVTSDNGLCTSTDDITVINNEPSEPYAGADEEYCSPTVVLKAAVPDFGTGNWSIIEGGGNFDDPTLPNATISNLNEGTNVLRWTITQGQCTKYSDIEVLNNTPTTADAGPDIEDCKDYADLDANSPTQGEGYWTLISGNADFADDTDEKTRVTGLTFGENILMWNIQKGGCISTDQITVFNQVPDQAEAGTNRSTCEDYLTLNANNPETGIGTWIILSGNGEFDDPNSPTTIVRELGLGENRFKWVVSYGECTTEDVVEVVSNKADPYAGEDAVTYESDFELKASNPGDLGATWSIVAGSGDFDDNTYFNTTVRNLSEGVNTFRWLMNVNGCITYDDVSVEYRVVPDAAFVVDTTQGCYPLSIQFTNYSDGGTEFLWEFGDGYSSTDRNPIHTFDDPGVYTVTLTAPGPDGVNGVYTKDITVFDHPVAEFSYSPDIVYVPGDLLRCYSLSKDAEKYFWEFGDGNTSTDVNPLHEYSTEGVFDLTLTVESQYGCTDQIIKANAITAVLQGFVKFPTAFMPRPDGGTSNTVGGGETNTVFRPVYRDVDQYKLQIFNRWGQLIYESTDIDEGWNGFYNSELSPQGVYVWKATGTFVSGKVFTDAGSVLLVR